jgi:hypothetical protein
MERHRDPATLARSAQMVATGFLIAILDGMNPMPGATGVPDSDVPLLPLKGAARLTVLFASGTPMNFCRQPRPTKV